MINFFFSSAFDMSRAINFTTHWRAMMFALINVLASSYYGALLLSSESGLETWTSHLECMHTSFAH